MSATTQQAPVIPPRPSRALNRDTIPKIPPRPINRHIERSLSPNPDRFAPSPLNESPFPSKPSNGHHLNIGNGGDPIDRPQSVEMPTVGEEGREYELLTEESVPPRERSVSPEQTRTIGADLKLHAPRPSLPAQSAKQRVMAVTRTDSDKAASFGIGRPSSEEHLASSSNRSLKKKASTTSQLSTPESQAEDEHGIPEIGQQVPMYPDAGDVQAPSPAPSSIAPEGRRSRNHARKTSSYGLPPGSYGLHGHGVVPQDSLERAYYEKHPDLLKKEHTPHHHDRPYDFSLTSDDLNKIVRDTASRGPAFAPNENRATPTEQVGWQAIEESTSHIASTGPSTSDAKSPAADVTTSSPDLGRRRSSEDTGVIHVEEPSRRRSVMFSDVEVPDEDEEEAGYSAPILAEDELRKHPLPYDYHPAVEPSPRVFESEDGTSRPSSRVSSRANSRPASLYKVSSMDHQSTPLEDVEEYEPLFPEDGGKVSRTASAPEPKTKTQHVHSHRFPSRDIWEDAPDSLCYTAQVSTPEISEEAAKPSTTHSPPPREGETPAQAFARRQEELAEQEVQRHGVDSFLPMKNTQKPIWAQHQSHLAAEKTRPAPTRRFPSRDVWEDVPDSLQLETTVSTPQGESEADSPAESKPEIPQRPGRKPTDPSSVSGRPAVPQRPKPKQTLSDEDFTAPVAPASTTSKPPVVPDKPKPHIPARPVKAGPTSGGLEPAEAAAPPKKKPAVPARPMGSKIAALQAGFMNDLNKKLGLGPQVPRKEEQAQEDDVPEAQEKLPLKDARKGRARGPQRRAPAKSPSPTAVSTAEKPLKPTLEFSLPSIVYEIDPEAGEVTMGSAGATKEDGEAPPVPRDATELELQKPQLSDKVDENKEKQKEGDTEEEGREEGVENKEDEAAAGYDNISHQDSGPLGAPTEQKEEAPVKEEVKSLATNMAGEAVVKEDLKMDENNDEVEPVKVEEC